MLSWGSLHQGVLWLLGADAPLQVSTCPAGAEADAQS